MINLTDKEILEYFKYMQEKEKHRAKALFFKLQYYYARRSEEIVRLNMEDIDLNNNSISLHIVKKKVETRLDDILLLEDIKKDLIDHIKRNDLKPNDYIFIEAKLGDNEKTIKKLKDNYKRNLRDYLDRNSPKDIKKLFNKDVTLGTHDFRRLGGQQLYLKGVDLEILQKLYYHDDLNQTIDYLQIQELEINNMLMKYRELEKD